MEKVGLGTLTLTGSNNSYSGSTTVQNGNLSVSGILGAMGSYNAVVLVGNTTTAGLSPTLSGGSASGAVNGTTHTYAPIHPHIAGSVTVRGPGAGSAGHFAPG